MSERCKAVLFDLDGTLIDSAVGIAEAVNQTLADLGAKREPEALIRDWIGDGANVLLQRALAHARIDIPQGPAFERVYALLMRHYGESLPLQAVPYPGVQDTLHELRRRGVKLALCTNKPERFIAPLFDALQWAPLFDAIVGGDTLPQRKPDAEPLLHVARGFGLEPVQCLMVGDSATDAGAALAATMPLVLVAFGYARDFDLRSAGALAVIDAMPDLLRLPCLRAE